MTEKGKDLTKVKYPSLIRGNVQFAWVYLEEGHSGNYDKDDVNDEPLLRIDLLTKNKKGQWEIVEGASTCTGISGSSWPITPSPAAM